MEILVTDVDKYRNLLINFELFTSNSEINKTIGLIDDILSKDTQKREVRARKLLIGKRPYPLKYVIIDLECNPPKLFGLLISNHLYQIFIVDVKYMESLYQTIAKVLSLLIDYYIFTFATFEKRFFTRILPFKFKLTQDRSIFETLKIVNIQLRDFEGMIPALYSIGEEAVDDPLLRDNKKINLHFKKGHYNLILEHNKSCLLSTQKIVKKRYLKETLI